MKEFNKLTQRLLSEGYSIENPPKDYITWDDFYGGWQYHAIQTKEMCVETPCGLIQKAWLVNDMSYGGVDWCLENDNALVFCPLSKKGCPKNNPLIRDLRIDSRLFCEAKITNKPFDYEKSISKLEERNYELEEARIKEFAKTCKNGFCREQLRFNSTTGEMWLGNDPIRCISSNCTYCTFRKQPISTKKGNVFYDIKTSQLYKGEGLIPDEMIVSVIKGVRFFDTNKSLTICEWIAERPDIIKEKAEDKYYRELFFSKHHGLHFEVEVLNVYAAARESRDLEQDLSDISNGFHVEHYTDGLKAAKVLKHENREKRVKSKINRIKKRIESSGRESLDISDLNRLEKFIKNGLVERSEVLKWQKIYEDNKDAGQLSLFERSD